MLQLIFFFLRNGKIRKRGRGSKKVRDQHKHNWEQQHKIFLREVLIKASKKLEQKKNTINHISYTENWKAM